MGAELLLCVSQEENTIPYKFRTTNISVYSFEEALYHCYHYWKQSIDDFMSDEFISWINDELGLSVIANNIKNIGNDKGFGERLLSFLTITDYFDYTRITKLKIALAAWEKRLEWERLKERGDYLIQNGEPSKAYILYKKSLAYEENTALLNNTGISLMGMDMFEDAAGYFEKALALDTENIQIMLNLSEAYIYNGNFEKALKLLKTAEDRQRDNGDIYYLYGELNMEAGNIRYSIDYFEKAITLKDDPAYYYRLADVYVKLRKYDNALETLNKVKNKDKEFLLRQAQLYVSANNVPAAIKCMERALFTDRNNIELWTKLAEYHRLDYDLTRALSAIQKALSIDPENDKARLEAARIKKALGKTKDYQKTLHDILIGFKSKYREIFSAE